MDEEGWEVVGSRRRKSNHQNLKKTGRNNKQPGNTPRRKQYSKPKDNVLRQSDLQTSQTTTETAALKEPQETKSGDSPVKSASVPHPHPVQASKKVSAGLSWSNLASAHLPDNRSSNVAFVESVEAKTSSEEQFAHIPAFDLLKPLLQQEAVFPKPPVLQRPVGFINTGQRCFIYSIIQSLFASTLFVSFLWKLINVCFEDIAQATKPKDTFSEAFTHLPALSALLSVFTSFTKGASSSERPALHAQELHSIGHYLPTATALSVAGQHDAAEYLLALAHQLHTEALITMGSLSTLSSKVSATRDSSSVSSSTSSSIHPERVRGPLEGSDVAGEWLEVRSKREGRVIRTTEHTLGKESLFSRLFYSRIRTAVSRGAMTARGVGMVEPMVALPLEMPQSTAATHHSLVSALERFTLVETVKADSSAAPAAAPQLVSLTREIQQPAPLLVFQLSRFVYSPSAAGIVKDLTPITFPALLRLPIKNRLFQYRLISVVTHVGKGIDTGHYTADVLYPHTKPGAEGQWYHCNDSEVSALSEKEVLANHSGAYLLFYEQIPA